MSYQSSKTKAPSTDVIAELGVRTKKSPREGQSSVTNKTNKRPKITNKDSMRGLGVEKPVKSPTKNNSVGKLISTFQQGASNR